MKKIIFIALALLLAACEKSIIDEDKTSSAQQDANVILHFTQYQQEAFTRSATDITNLCSRLNIAIFGNCRCQHVAALVGVAGRWQLAAAVIAAFAAALTGCAGV